MCGIAGFWGPGEPTIIASMLARLRHRGPDCADMIHLGDVQLGATRLAIVAPDGGAQPMFAPEHGLHLVFNGEIYNHGDLRKHLRTKGHQFRTDSDTEVVLRMYHEYGTRLLDHIEGMYAFAIYDGHELFLARDPLGIKPLYVTRFGDCFAFASEIAPLLCLPGISCTLDEQTFVDWRVIGYPTGCSTFVAGVESAPPGAGLRLCDRAIVQTHYKRDRTTSLASPPATLDEAIDTVRLALTTAVRSHMAADVEVAVLLSGGVDSSLMALAAAEFGGQDVLRTFTVVPSKEEGENALASIVADATGSEHQCLILDFDTFVSLAPECLRILEIPMGLAAVPPLYAVRTMNAQGIRCALIGEGADELFGGYPDHINRRNLTEAAPKRAAEYAQRGLHVSPALAETLERIRSAASVRDYSAQVLDLYLGDQLRHLHLDPVDKIGMSAGVELRVPYLADQLVTIIRGLPMDMKINHRLGIQKYVLRHLMLGHSNALADIALQRKTGFPAACRRHIKDLGARVEALLPDAICGQMFAWAFDTKLGQLCFASFCEHFLGENNGASSFWSDIAKSP